MATMSAEKTRAAVISERKKFGPIEILIPKTIAPATVSRADSVLGRNRRVILLRVQCFDVFSDAFIFTIPEGATLLYAARGLAFMNP